MSDECSLDAHDRSISSLRTLRMPEDGDIFWFRDDLHQPYPICPLGMTTIQKHHAWGYHVGAEVTRLPPSKGGHVKIYKGRTMLGFEALTDPAEVAQRAVEFTKLLDYARPNWDTFYNGYIDEVKQGLIYMASVHDGFADTDLHQALRRSEAINRRNWEIHFILMYVADMLYFGFEAFCKERGLAEKEFAVMLKGLDTMATRTDTGVFELAKLADTLGIADTILSSDAKALLPVLEKEPKAVPWLSALHAFLDAYGHRITAGHLDIIFPTWIEEPSPVLDTVKTYIPKVRQGWDIKTERHAALKEADQAAQAFMATLTPSDQDAFTKQLAIGRKIYRFQEDHGFYIDGASTAGLHDVAMALGRRLTHYGLFSAPDDVFFLNYYELEETLALLAENRIPALYHFHRLIPPLVKERRKGWELTATLKEAPLTLGKIPEKAEDPILVKVFGMVDEVLKAGKVDELQMMDTFEGYPGSPGVAEGLARVVTSFEAFPTLQPGEILVCPYTATAWTPLFPKIKAVVTDTGGMLTHAAITAREYRIPAVVGTWRATRSIKDGDYIRVDGNRGVVEVMKKA
ncbi:MAG TPA: PEP-utilizing enzyme [Syntrophorhabdales bacterium]|nr:PEP-utilizing enzyme [Syntrophorhabdales bacterium]